MKLFLFGLIVNSAGAGAALAGSEPPEILRRAFAQRALERLQTADIEWSHTPAPVPGIIDVPRTQFYRARCTPDQEHIIELGDEDRVVLRRTDGSRALNPYSGPLHWLKTGLDLWSYHEEAWYASVADADSLQGFLPDIRRLGLEPNSNWSRIDAVLAEAGFPPPQYSTRREADQVVVSAEVGDGRFEWWIDPARDDSIVRIVTYDEGVLIGEKRIELEQFDGVWFPFRYEVYRAQGGNLEPNPASVTQIVWAEFNRPEHPRQITPADIGIEPGTLILHGRSVEPLPADRNYVWDGAQVAILEEFRERVQRGEAREGRTILRERARTAARAERRALLAEQSSDSGEYDEQAAAHNPALGWRRIESRWEAYTRAFIEHYQLADDQAQRAWRVCKGAQERARALLGRIREDLAQQERVYLAPVEQVHRERAARAMERLLRPIDEIFEQSLRPGLEKLPTPEQRTRAGAFKQKSPSLSGGRDAR